MILSLCGHKLKRSPCFQQEGAAFCLMAPNQPTPVDSPCCAKTLAHPLEPHSASKQRLCQSDVAKSGLCTADSQRRRNSQESRASQHSASDHSGRRPSRMDKAYSDSPCRTWSSQTPEEPEVWGKAGRCWSRQWSQRHRHSRPDLLWPAEWNQKQVITWSCSSPVLVTGRGRLLMV